MLLAGGRERMKARILLVALLVLLAVLVSADAIEDAEQVDAVVKKCARVPASVRDGCYRSHAKELALLAPALARQMCNNITGGEWRDECHLSMAIQNTACNGLNNFACRASRGRFQPGCDMIENATMAVECNDAFSFSFSSNGIVFVTSVTSFIVNNPGTTLVSILKFVVLLCLVYFVYWFIFLEEESDEFVRIELVGGALTVINVSETDLENATIIIRGGKTTLVAFSLSEWIGEQAITLRVPTEKVTAVEVEADDLERVVVERWAFEPPAEDAHAKRNTDDHVKGNENSPASESATSSPENDETVESSMRKRESGSTKGKRSDTSRPRKQKRRNGTLKRG